MKWDLHQLEFMFAQSRKCWNSSVVSHGYACNISRRAACCTFSQHILPLMSRFCRLTLNQWCWANCTGLEGTKKGHMSELLPEAPLFPHVELNLSKETSKAGICRYDVGVNLWLRGSLCACGDNLIDAAMHRRSGITCPCGFLPWNSALISLSHMKTDWSTDWLCDHCSKTATFETLTDQQFVSTISKILFTPARSTDLQRNEPWNE